MNTLRFAHAFDLAPAGEAFTVGSALQVCRTAVVLLKLLWHAHVE